MFVTGYADASWFAEDKVPTRGLGCLLPLTKE